MMQISESTSPGIRFFVCLSFVMSLWESVGESRLVVTARGIHDPGRGKRYIFKAQGDTQGQFPLTPK